MEEINESSKSTFLESRTDKSLLFATLLMAVIYFVFLAFWFQKGNPYLYAALLVGEVFHLWQAFTFVHTVWNVDHKHKQSKIYRPAVDVYITVAGEPADIVEETVIAAKNMTYPKFKVYILNDGKVAGKPNWEEMELLAKRLGVECITREVPGGAKAGNINNALGQSSSPFVAIFDADQVPHGDFLQKTVGYFFDPKVAFVQSPQFYKNSGLNEVTRGAWEQQELFFGPICRGKNRMNSTFMCGTNMIIRKAALLEVGGMCEDNIAEDFLTSLFLHQKGYKSVYVPEILAEGLAPEDFLSYYKQQFRWARGSLEVVFSQNPLFKKGLSWGQKMEYLASATYYLSGTIVLLNALLPIIFFFTGLMPLNISTMTLAAIFLPYIILTVVALKLSSNFTYTFRALAFSMSSFGIQIQALLAVLLGKKTTFTVTSKKQVEGSFMRLALPHIFYILLALVGVEVAILREGLSAALISNLCWALFNISAFMPFIVASSPELSKMVMPQVPSPVKILNGKNSLPLSSGRKHAALMQRADTSPSQVYTAAAGKNRF